MNKAEPQTRMQQIGYPSPDNHAEPDQLVGVEYVSGGRVAIIALKQATEGGSRSHPECFADRQRDFALPMVWVG